MRKNDLIKILQETKGNPEVLFWNGEVGDWMNISVSEDELSKQTLEAYLLLCLHQRKQQENNPKFEFSPEETEQMKKLYKTVSEWDAYEFVNRDDKFFGEKLRDWKKVLLIQVKSRGKTTWDRLGTIQY